MTDTIETEKKENPNQKQRNDQLPTVEVGHGGVFFNSDALKHAQRAAIILMESDMVPKQYKPDRTLDSKTGLPKRSEKQALANCVIALDIAACLRQNALIVMQNLDFIHGKPCWSTKYLIGALNRTNKYSGINYEWRGEEGTDEWACRATATELSSGMKKNGSWVSVKMAKAEKWWGKEGSKWPNMTEHMLMNRAATFFVRMYAPELTLGYHTEEEVQDMRDVTPEMPGRDQPIRTRRTKNQSPKEKTILAPQIDQKPNDDIDPEKDDVSPQDIPQSDMDQQSEDETQDWVNEYDKGEQNV